MAALSNTPFNQDSLIRIEHDKRIKQVALKQLQVWGYCQPPEVSNPGGITITYAQLFAAVYSSALDSTFPNDPTLHVAFRQVLKDFLLTPMLRGHNIWEDFMRKLFVLRSFRYLSPTNISLDELFHPAIQVGNCLANTQIVMKHMHPISIRFRYPPSPRTVTRTPSIWFPESQFESGLDTLLFFRRAASSSSSAASQGDQDQRNSTNLICVGIQNKWSEDDQTKISYSAMRKAINYFRSKMTTRGWDETQLYFLFIINQDLYDYFSVELDCLFDEQIGIISTAEKMLDRWLSPTVKLMVTRFQALAKHNPSHEVYDESMTQDEVDAYKAMTTERFKQLTESDQGNPARNIHFGDKKRSRPDSAADSSMNKRSNQTT
jgi:hypothetical protein